MERRLKRLVEDEIGDGHVARVFARSCEPETDALGEAVFASTIQASVLGTDSPDELDEAEIERSIKEINEAIQRSSKKKG